MIYIGVPGRLADYYCNIEGASKYTMEYAMAHSKTPAVIKIQP